MPRRLTWLPRQFKQMHRLLERDGKDMHALVKQTGYTLVHCYRLCKKHGLKMLVPHNRQADVQFKEAHGKARTLDELAATLGTTKSTVFMRCKKLGLPTNLSHAAIAENMRLAWESYRGLMSIADVARIMSCGGKRVRALLWAGVKARWDTADEKPPWPRPARVDDIRVYIELTDDPGLIADVPRLCELTDISERWVEGYIRRIR